MNYYILLGVAQDADADTIRSAFRGLARRYHPDAGEGSSADRFREVLVSYRPIVGHSFSPIGGQAISPEWGPPVFGR